MITPSMYRNHAAFIAATLLMAAADRSAGTRKGQDKEATTIADPYQREDVDWFAFNAKVGERLDTASYASDHVKRLIAATTDDLADGNKLAETPIPDELRDNPIAQLFGMAEPRAKVVPHDPDVPATLRTIADALDAAWMETTGKVGAAQPNATFRG